MTLLSRFVQIPLVVEFTECRVFAGIDLGRIRVRQAWLEAGPGQWDAVEFEIGASSETFREGIRWQLDETGFRQLGSVDANGQFTPWEPACDVLTSEGLQEPVTSLHTKGARTVERIREVQPSLLFPEGLAVVVDTRGGESRAVLRDHFAPYIGWIGFEGLILRPNGQLRLWSEDVVRDGVPVVLPEPAEES